MEPKYERQEILKLKCPNCNYNLSLIHGYTGADSECEKGKGSDFGWVLSLACSNCYRSYPLGHTKDVFDFSPVILKPYDV